MDQIEFISYAMGKLLYEGHKNLKISDSQFDKRRTNEICRIK